MTDFQLRTIDGKAYSLKESGKGQAVILVDFWASWCLPCRAEMPEFVEMQNKYRERGLVILAINEDDNSKDRDDYLRRMPVNFPVLVDPGHKVREHLGIEVYPTTILLGPDGRVLSVKVGADPYLSSHVQHMVESKEKASEGHAGPASITRVTVESKGDTN
jgi:thiol-disulfide isomerase/thioredoxin